ncbi:MAG: type II toxin-antitoxin system RatA family toxin [Gammaproteobacteria bacterium]|nr:type II toxin-antitoxin system RatA family toxin [Gammaproteobacteria bacterium]MDE2346053.1 type II toxin-antitoxin system RatA family toxin [Gammaproteobacteria bacterium]
MPSCSLERRLPHSPEQIFDLVIDVEHYQEFLPLDFSARVMRRQPGQIQARQSLRIGPMSLSFESTATYRRPDWIRIESISGPFSRFLIAWDFIRMERGSLVRIQVECSTHSAPLSALLAPWMETFTNGLVSAFEKRAQAVYSANPGQ